MYVCVVCMYVFMYACTSPVALKSQSSLCMYVCMYVCICLYMTSPLEMKQSQSELRSSLYMYVYVYMCACCACVQPSLYMYVNVYMCACCVCMPQYESQASLCMYVCMCVWVCVRVVYVCHNLSRSPPCIFVCVLCTRIYACTSSLAMKQSQSESHSSLYVYHVLCVCVYACTSLLVL
jgi:hypothetical protein